MLPNQRGQSPKVSGSRQARQWGCARISCNLETQCPSSIHAPHSMLPTTIHTSGWRTSKAWRRSPGRRARMRSRKRATRPRFEADRDALAAIFDRPDKIPLHHPARGLLYNFWLDLHHPRGLWRRTTLAEFRTDAPSWEVLIDIDALAASEGEDSIGAAHRPCRHPMSSPFCGCRAAAVTPLSCGSSTLSANVSSRTVFICRRPRAARSSWTRTRCSWAQRSAAATL